MKPSPLVALFDAHPEHAHFESPFEISRARTLGSAIGAAGFGIVLNPSTPALLAALGSHTDAKTPSVVLSPAASRDEHTRVFRLPTGMASVIYTGRGAFGADMMALLSSEALIVLGSYPKTLETILRSAKKESLPVGILTDEDSSSIHERIRAIDPQIAPHLFISHDPAVLVREISGEIRRRELSRK